MKILVAGIGNIFLGDDGFGVEVANRLRRPTLPDGVRVEDFGIRGVHLAYELLDGYDALVLIDAVPMGEPPGTVAIIEPDPVGEVGDVGELATPAMDAHSMNPAVVLADARVPGRPCGSGARRRLPTLGDRRGHRSLARGRAAVERGVDAVREVSPSCASRTEERSPA